MVGPQVKITKFKKLLIFKIFRQFFVIYPRNSAKACDQCSDTIKQIIQDGA